MFANIVSGYWKPCSVMHDVVSYMEVIVTKASGVIYDVDVRV